MVRQDRISRDQIDGNIVRIRFRMDLHCLFELARSAQAFIQMVHCDGIAFL